MQNENEHQLPDDQLACPQKYESENVHRVYDQIADHFDSTRYKPWPVVEAYLKGLPAGSLGLDVGCGNGKYLNCNPSICILGSDMCEGLLKSAKQKCPSNGLIVANALNLPFAREGLFDFVISIAVIHHLCSAERRRTAIDQILKALRKGGSGLIFVWAWEQQHPNAPNKRKYAQQDAQVSWLHNQTGKTHYRYYHMFKEGELQALLEEASLFTGIQIEILRSGNDRDNWWAEFKRC